MAARQFLWVIVYNVQDPSRQRRVREILRFNGNEVRACVYELIAAESTLNKLLNELALELSPEDDVRVYRVCETCRQKTFVFGEAEIASPAAAIIV